MNEEIVKSYSIFAYTGFRVLTTDDDDLTDDLKKLIVVDGENGG